MIFTFFLSEILLGFVAVKNENISFRDFQKKKVKAILINQKTFELSNKTRKHLSYQIKTINDKNNNLAKIRYKFK